MGLLEEIDKLELSDEAKASLRASALKDMAPALSADAETYVGKLRSIGFSEENGCTGFLKNVRRILMSADAHEEGAILMSDADLGLTGDKATGATQREAVSLAGQLKALFDSLPTADSEGQKKLVVALSDQALAAEAGNEPDKTSQDDPQRKHTQARDGLNKVTGANVTGVSRKRYRRGVAATGGTA